MINFFKENTWSAETVIKTPNKKVEGWALPEMPGESEKIYLLPFSTMCVLLLCSSASCRFTNLTRILLLNVSGQSLYIVRYSWSFPSIALRISTAHNFTRDQRAL